LIAERNVNGNWIICPTTWPGGLSRTPTPWATSRSTATTWAGQLTSARDPLGRLTKYDYNLRGWLTKVTDALEA